MVGRRVDTASMIECSRDGNALGEDWDGVTRGVGCDYDVIAM